MKNSLDGFIKQQIEKGDTLANLDRSTESIHSEEQKEMKKN